MRRSLQTFGRIIVSPNIGNPARFALFVPRLLPNASFNRTIHSSISLNRKQTADINAKIIGAAEWHSVPQVSVVNISSKNGQPACFGIFWGDNDPMNVLKKCSPSRSNIFYSSVDGILLALRQAIHERKLDKVIVRTDSDYLISCATRYLKNWRNNDYKKRNGEDVKNKEDLRDLDIMLSQIEAKFEKIEAPFHVIKKLKSFSNSDVDIDTDIYDPTSTGATIFVHGAYVEKPYENGSVFKIAAYGVRFKGNESADLKERMAKFPSAFRAQMYGILKALQLAKVEGLQNVQIVCDSPFFLTYHKKGWKKKNGEPVANLPIYQDIMKVANELNASFRYLPENSDNSDFRAAALLAEDGLGMPITDTQSNMPKDSSGKSWLENFFNNYKEDLVKTAEEWKDVPQIHAVHHESSKGRKCYAIFDQSSDNNCFSSGGNIVSGIVKLLIPVLEKKIEDGTTRLVLRTDVDGLIMYLKCYLKKWESKGYVTAQGKDVINADLYKKMSKLMEKIDLRIELFDEAEQELDYKAYDYCKEQAAKKSQKFSAID